MPDPDLLATDDGKTRYASYFSTLETECGHWRRMILSKFCPGRPFRGEGRS